MKTLKYFALIFIVSLLCIVPLQANATLTAHLDRNQIIEGEAVQLIIEASGQVSEMPETQALNEDFDILGMISGSRVNIVNGRVDSRTTWTLSLTPKRSGELIIPSLTINGEQTPTLILQVNDASTGSDPDANIPVFIETEVDKTNPYVQSMVRYTIRVFFSVQLVQGSLTEPELENALVQRLGDDREYQAMHDGKSYHVIEREFMIFPQTSGNLLIPAPVLNAQIPENNSRQDPFFNRVFTNNRPIRLRGDAVMLEVQARPDQSKSQIWLPAESVELLEDWQPNDGQITVGDPLTRNITIQALGVTGEQLPDLQFVDIDGFKLYPDRAQSNTQKLPRNIQGEKTLRLAYMPTQPGDYTLPEFILHWWDTQTNQERIATLPERSIKVIPATNPSQSAVTQPIDPAAQLDDMENFLRAKDTTNVSISPLNKNGWFWMSLVFATLWLITLGLWWLRRHSSHKHTNELKTPNQGSKNSRKARKLFLSACQANNARQARHYLLQWTTIHWPETPPKGLEDIASRLNNPAISAALTTLDRMLYQSDNKNWDGRELAKLLSKLPQHQQKSGSNNTLPELYARN
ncbi:MAG: BatD family protein [Nitrosomonas sp.]|nr:BatD family protein [Nitrosomonas sp.]